MASKQRTTNVYSLTGEVVKSVPVPAAFETQFRPDMIKRAVVAAEANRRQAYGPGARSGMRHSVSTWGKGRGVSRVQRLKSGRKGAQSPNNVSGRRAHPPKPERDWSKKVNQKERIFARLSALAATGNEEAVRDRGHLFSEGVSFPVVMEDGFQELMSTQEVYAALTSLGLDFDMERAKDGRKIRAGKGTMRNRKYRIPRSILLVVAERDMPLFKGAANLPGVEVEVVSALNSDVLAPGGDPGRLTVYSESALAVIGGWDQ